MSQTSQRTADLGKADVIHDPDSLDSSCSPCIDCQSYSYYGCSRPLRCARYVVWKWVRNKNAESV